MSAPRIVEIDEEPFDTLPCLNALGRGQVERVELPILGARVDRLPDALDALVAAADLQALELPGRGPQRLIGEALAERLLDLVADPSRTGILLAGDLYTVPDLARRGGSGDVASVWRAFGERFRWVAGVLGNHDELASRRLRGGYLLDGEVRDLDGLRVGGVHGIIGNPGRLNRQAPDAFVAKLEDALLAGVEVLVLHEGPDGPGEKLRGNAAIRDALEHGAEVARPLVVCGHSWWPVPLVELAHGVQVLKVDARVVVMERA